MTKSGGFTFQIGSADTGTRDLGLDNPIGVFTPLRAGGPWSELRRLVHPRRDGGGRRSANRKGWQANRVAASLERSEQGVDGDLSLAIVLGDNTPELHATYRYAAEAQKLDLNVALDGLDPAALAPLAPVLTPLRKRGCRFRERSASASIWRPVAPKGRGSILALAKDGSNPTC